MKAFSELTSASQVNNGDLLAISQTSGSGYASKKTTVKDITDKANHNVADEYDNTSTYAVGVYVMYESTLYKCTTAVSSAENFDSTKWTAVLVTDEMGSGGGGGTGGHTIIDENGNSMSARAGLQFFGAVEVRDDNANNRTLVEVLGGDFYNPVIYSTTERVIGVWTDGKPLYQKTWDFGQDVSFTSNVWTDTPILIDDFDIEKVISIPQATNTSGTNFDMTSANSDHTYVQLLNIRNATISIRYLTLQYTKSTDTAGSGSWTPQGVPTIHYSTDEQVIGTYLGETLCQKTWVLENAITLTSNTWTAIPPIPKTLFSKILNCEVINNAGSYVGFIQTAFDSAASDYLRLINVRNANVDVKEITLRYTKSS